MITAEAAPKSCDSNPCPAAFGTDQGATGRADWVIPDRPPTPTGAAPGGHAQGGSNGKDQPSVKRVSGRGGRSARRRPVRELLVAAEAMAAYHTNVIDDIRIRLEAAITKTKNESIFITLFETPHLLYSRPPRSFCCPDLVAGDMGPNKPN